MVITAYDRAKEIGNFQHERQPLELDLELALQFAGGLESEVGIRTFKVQIESEVTFRH
jgi:hypothetical protein